jgi:hypothetical protein
MIVNQFNPDALAPYGIELEPIKPLAIRYTRTLFDSGTQITSGLALPAPYYWMLKSYDVVGLPSFIVMATVGCPLK